MQRREFLAASTAAALGLAGSTLLSAADAPPPGGKGPRQLIDLRTYHFASPEKMQAFDEFLAKAAVPAFNRAGANPVGVFKFLKADNEKVDLSKNPTLPTDLFVILPHKSAESFAAFEATLAADKAFQEAGSAVLTAPKNNPAYARYESSLLLGFEDCPAVQAPSKAATRLAQLRIYESHNNERALKKIAMFNNEGGEIKIFNRVGLNPVFFGQALAGARMPNLTYMVAFDDEAAQKKAWDAFRADPAWKKLSADEAYKDTVSNITNWVLRPTPASQI